MALHKQLPGQASTCVQLVQPRLPQHHCAGPFLMPRRTNWSDRSTPCLLTSRGGRSCCSLTASHASARASAHIHNVSIAKEFPHVLSSNGNHPSPSASTAAECTHMPGVKALPPTPAFRFWHDEKRFKGCGDTSLAQAALLALGGARVGGHIKSAPTQGPLGWQRLAAWDVLWSPSATAKKAVAVGLRPGQLASALPGSECLTKKRRLSATLTAAYDASTVAALTPLTFELPNQMRTWIQYLRQSSQSSRSSESSQTLPAAADEASLPTPLTIQRGAAAAAAAATGTCVLQPPGIEPNTSEPLWILKTAQHLGKGVRIVTQREAVKAVVVRQQAVMAASNTKPKSKQPRSFVVAQRYIPQPLLLRGRKFGIRLWVLVTSVQPLRLYCHRNGLVLFSSQAYDAAATDNMQAHLTNYAQNQNGEVWSLDQLEQELGPAAHATLMQAMHRITALTFAAGAPGMRAAAAALPRPPPPGSCFELFGLDFLIDQQLQPWLLEVNSTPSLAAEHESEAVRLMIHQQKSGMVADMFSLLGLTTRFKAPATSASQPQSQPPHHTVVEQETSSPLTSVSATTATAGHAASAAASVEGGGAASILLPKIQVVRQARERLSGPEVAGGEEGEGEGAEGQGNTVEVGETLTVAPPPLPLALTTAKPSSLSSNSDHSSLMDHTMSAPGLGALTNLTLSHQEELQQQPGQREQGDSQLHEFVHRFSPASELQTQQMVIELQALRRELRARGGFLPLMPLLPTQAAIDEGGWSLPVTHMDEMLVAWCEQS